MGATVGPLVDELQRRLRDTSAIAHADAVVLRALSHAQGLIAVGLRAYTETFTFTSQEARLIYNIPGDIDNRIVLPRTVQVGSRDIPWAPYNALRGMDAAWFRQFGVQYLAWSMVGRDLLILYPAIPTQETVSVIAYAFPTAITANTDVTALEDRWEPFLLEMAELFLLLRSRRLGALERLITRLREKRAEVLAGKALAIDTS